MVIIGVFYVKQFGVNRKQRILKELILLKREGSMSEYEAFLVRIKGKPSNIEVIDEQDSS